MKKETDRRTEEFADLFLNSLDYSPEFAAADEKIRAALREKAREMPFEELAERYGSLEKPAELAGCTAQDAKLWRGSGEVKYFYGKRRTVFRAALLLYTLIFSSTWPRGGCRSVRCPRP